MKVLEASLEKIEAQMHQIAIQWIKDKKLWRNRNPMNSDIRANFEGIQIHSIVDCQKAINTVNQKLAGQRRMAKSRHPRYDLNRHIRLKSNLDELELLRSSLIGKFAGDIQPAL